MKAFVRLSGRSSPRPSLGVTEQRYVYTDLAGILDIGLRMRIENWPSALHADGAVRPAALWAIKRTHEGLSVESASWWGSASALDRQIELAVDIGRRILARR